MLDEELAFANEAADRAAEIALAHLGPTVVTRLKEDGTPVTEADLSIEAMFREAVARRFPDDAIVGEEKGWGATAERTWIIDPIDGTANFVRGASLWATLIALAIDGEPILGMAVAPVIGERYEAIQGGGAHLNGKPLRVSTTKRVEDAVICHTGLEEWTAILVRRPSVNSAGRSAGYTGSLMSPGIPRWLVAQPRRRWSPRCRCGIGPLRSSSSRRRGVG